ncbi:hypothetical protein [Fodinicola feengrottensis]|uniref:ESAT-6-like protein n=1 Tax=Fodinicola feengrottensis TaxID=435914 RepID=A0ABN2JC62_9ACTN|nr:hypothetical protein [Fodinicola feengrottensis]
MRVQGNFAMLQNVQQQVQTTMGHVQNETDNWQRVMNQLAHEWPDGAQAQLQEVHHARAQMNQAHQQMLQVFHRAVGHSVVELNQAVSSAKSNIANVPI